MYRLIFTGDHFKWATIGISLTKRLTLKLKSIRSVEKTKRVDIFFFFVVNYFKLKFELASLDVYLEFLTFD